MSLCFPSQALEPSTVLLAQSTYEDERLALRALRWCERPLFVRSVRDGEAGRKALGLGNEGVGAPPDLILCDLRLPSLDGDELLRLAREDPGLRNVPFVLLARAPSPSEVERGLALGASAFLQRPVPYEEALGLFHAVVEWALDGLDGSKLAPFRPVVPKPRRTG